MDTITAVGRLSVGGARLHARGALPAPDPLPKLQHPLLLNGGCFYPPTDYAKWAEFVRNWATHANDRYPNVAADWLWELWNEPDIGYWNGTFAEYAKLYDYTESALHQAHPEGGAGRTGGDRCRRALLAAISRALRDRDQRCHRRDGNASGSRDLPRQGRRSHQSGTRRARPRQPTSLAPRRLRHRGRVFAIQTNADLHHRGGSRWLRRVPGGQHSWRWLPNLDGLRCL